MRIEPNTNQVRIAAIERELMRLDKKRWKLQRALTTLRAKQEKQQFVKVV